MPPGAAEWMVDAQSLRATLDALCASLASPPLSFGSIVAPYRQDVTDHLRELCDVLARTDLAARRALAGVDPEPRAAHDLPQLAELLASLAAATDARTTAELGPAKRTALARLLAHDAAPDLLAILGKEHDENAHSDVLRHLLDPATSPTLAPAALDALAGLLPDADAWRPLLRDAIARDCLSVRRELTLGRARRESSTPCARHGAALLSTHSSPPLA